MKKVSEHPIVATVVGGLLLSFLLSVFAWLGGYWPAIWEWASGVAAGAWNAVMYPVPIPAFVVVVVAVFVISWIIQRISNAQPNNDENSVLAEAVADGNADLKAVAKALSKEEMTILVALVRLDGESIDVDTSKEVLGLSNLKTQQVLELLEEKRLIHRYTRLGRPESVLTNLGRDLMLMVFKHE